jgi:CRP-like cAMP-binding protein
MLTIVTPRPSNIHAWRNGHAAAASQERNRLLAALPEDEYAALLPHLEMIDVPAERVIAFPEEELRHVYFQRDGLVSMFVPMEDGKSVVGAVVGNEGMIGLQAFLGDGVAREEMVQVAAGQAARISVSRFRELMHESPTLHTILMRYTLALLTDIARTAGCNRVHSVEQRLARLLLLMSDRTGRRTLAATHDVLSSMLGARRASVTQAACILAESGLIDYRRGLVTLTDIAGLAAAACEDYRHSLEAFERMFDALGALCLRQEFKQPVVLSR